MKKCPKCHLPVNIDNKYCDQCGYFLIENDGEMKIKWFSIGLLTGLFSIIFLIVYYDIYPKRIKMILLGGIIHLLLLGLICFFILLGILF